MTAHIAGFMMNLESITKPVQAKEPMQRKGIYKRGNVWWIRYADAQGHMFYESSKSNSVKVAEAMLVARKREALEGNLPVKVQATGNQSFRELAGHYYAWAERQKSFKCSKQYFIKALVAEFGNCPLKSFSFHVVEKYQSKILASGKKPATANRLLATLQHMFNKGLEWEMVGEDVVNRVKKVKLLPENNRRLRFLSAEECDALIKACSPHLRPIVVTALHTGMRKSEILSLQWDKHVDLVHGFILLDLTKSGKRREIPINKTLMDELKRIPRHLKSPYVLTTLAGNSVMSGGLLLQLYGKLESRTFRFTTCDIRLLLVW